MPNCSLHYVPERLHWNDKPLLISFQLGDLIYRRCKPEDLENPFKYISLRDISNNIGSCQAIQVSQPDDVLINIDEDSKDELYDGQITCTLQIIELTESNDYQKFDSQEKNGHTYQSKVKLLHDPLCCMYPHCIFRIWIDDVVVTEENYNDTLQKLKIIRTKIRQDLALMIRRGEIRINFD